MTHLRRVALPLLLAFSPALAVAQNEGRMSGQVTDHEGNPVKGAVVRLVATDDRGTNVETKTKKNGKYLFGLIRPAPYRLEMEAPEGMVLLRMAGEAVDLTNKDELWSVDQEVSATNLPPLNVGTYNQIRLDMVVGPPSMTPEAKQEAAIQASQTAYASGLEKVKSGDFTGAVADLEPLLAQSPDHASTNYLMAFSKNQLGEPDAALVHVDRALAGEPGFGGAHVLRGRILQALNRTDEAEAEFRKELEGAATPDLKMESWIALAVLYEKTERHPQAIEILEQATAENPRRELLLELAELYATSGEREKAAATLERAEEAGGMDDVALLNLAVGYINDKNYKEAERLSLRLVEKGSTNPNLSMAHSILARCDLNRGNMKEGIEHLKKALELDPNSPLAEENREIVKALEKH